MARFWLTLLDDVLIWLNQLLGCVAAMLTILVLQAKTSTSPTSG
jgi:hypothetical protein